MSNGLISDEDQRSSQSHEGPSSPPGANRISRGLIAGLGGLALVIAVESDFLDSKRDHIHRPMETASHVEGISHSTGSIDSVLSDKRNAVQTFKAWGRETAHALNASTKESMVYQVPAEVLSGFKAKARKFPLIYFSDLISRGKGLERKIRRAATPQDRALIDQARKKYPGIAYALAYLAGVSEGPSVGWYLVGLPSRLKDAGLVFYIGHSPKAGKIVLALDASYKTAGKPVAKASDAVAVFDDGPAERYFTSVVLSTICKEISQRYKNNPYVR